MKKLAIISLGSNKGVWRHIFQSAYSSINNLGNLDLKSSIYKTEPWGVKDQPWFKNQIIGLKTNLTSNDLLLSLLQIESKNGRNRQKEKRWGERTLDLDILFFGNEIKNDIELVIPHPRLESRMFILQPLAEIYPELIHPVTGKKALDLLQSCKDETQVEKLIDVL